MSVLSRRRRGHRHVLALAVAVALCALSTVPPTAQAQLAPAKPPTRHAVSAPGVTTPAKTPALAHAARTLPASAKGMGMALAKPTPGRAPRTTGDVAPQDLTCVPYLSKLVTPNVNGPGTVEVDYLAELVCNFYLSAAGVAYLYDRTDGATYNGYVISTAQPFSFSYDSYGYSTAGVIIDGGVYDGARQVEIGFDLALRTADGTPWGTCYVPLPNGERYLSTCDGLGTDTLTVSVGSGIFDTGLAPFNAAAVIRDSPTVTLLTSHVSGQSDPASTARQNIVDAAAGLPARTSTFSHVGATSVYLDGDMLLGMVKINKWDGYSYRVTAIAGGRHGSADSRHYLGKAFDVDTINGVPVNASNPYFRAFLNLCASYGATELLGPGNAGHDTHVHCAWPR